MSGEAVASAVVSPAAAYECRAGTRGGDGGEAGQTDRQTDGQLALLIFVFGSFPQTTRITATVLL